MASFFDGLDYNQARLYFGRYIMPSQYYGRWRVTVCDFERLLHDVLDGTFDSLEQAIAFAEQLVDIEVLEDQGVLARERGEPLPDDASPAFAEGWRRRDNAYGEGEAFELRQLLEHI